VVKVREVVSVVVKGKVVVEVKRAVLVLDLVVSAYVQSVVREFLISVVDPVMKLHARSVGQR